MPCHVYTKAGVPVGYINLEEDDICSETINVTGMQSKKMSIAAIPRQAALIVYVSAALLVVIRGQDSVQLSRSSNETAKLEAEWRSSVDAAIAQLQAGKKLEYNIYILQPFRSGNDCITPHRLKCLKC